MSETKLKCSLNVANPGRSYVTRSTYLWHNKYLHKKNEPVQVSSYFDKLWH